MNNSVLVKEYQLAYEMVSNKLDNLSINEYEDEIMKLCNVNSVYASLSDNNINVTKNSYSSFIEGIISFIRENENTLHLQDSIMHKLIKLIYIDIDIKGWTI